MRLKFEPKAKGSSMVESPVPGRIAADRGSRVTLPVAASPHRSRASGSESTRGVGM